MQATAGAISNISGASAGNENIITALRGAMRAERVPHALLFTGPRGVGKFTRTLALPFPVDADKVEARFENGVLQITLAKHESAKARKIQVKSE